MAVPPYVTAGTTIDETWGDQIADAVVNPFASSAARSAAITAPTTGMTSTITAASALNGFEVYNGVSWNKPWSSPWGVVGFGTSTSDNTPSAVSQTSIGLTTAAMTLYTNRRYQINYTCSILASAAPAQTLTFELWNASAKVVSLQSLTATGTAYFVASGVAYATVSASTPTWAVRCLTSGGGGVSIKGTVSPMWLTVTDIGPTGTPT